MMPFEENNQMLFKSIHTFNFIIEVINDRLMYMQGMLSQCLNINKITLYIPILQPHFMTHNISLNRIHRVTLIDVRYSLSSD